MPTMAISRPGTFRSNTHQPFFEGLESIARLAALEREILCCPWSAWCWRWVGRAPPSIWSARCTPLAGGGLRGLPGSVFVPRRDFREERVGIVGSRRFADLVENLHGCGIEVQVFCLEACA